MSSATCTARTAARASGRGVRDGHGVHFSERVAGAEALEHERLFVVTRIPHAQAQEKAVDLCFGQRKGPLELHRVLRREQHERPRQGVRDAVDGHAALLHRLEEGRLGARRGAVDLVGQHDVGKQRSRAELELAALLVEDHRARHVGGQKVGGALDSREAQTQGGGDRAHQQGLGNAGHVVEQHVPVGQQGDRDQARLVGFADDDAPHLVGDRAAQLDGCARGDRGGGVVVYGEPPAVAAVRLTLHQAGGGWRRATASPGRPNGVAGIAATPIRPLVILAAWVYDVARKAWATAPWQPPSADRAGRVSR